MKGDILCPFCKSEEVWNTGAINFFCEKWYNCESCDKEFRVKYGKVTFPLSFATPDPTQDT